MSGRDQPAAAAPSAARRIFLGQAGLSVAAAVAATLGSRLRGMAGTSPQGLAPPALPEALARDAGWHVDDMWGPRYAHPVPYQHDAAPPQFAHVAPVDRPWVS